MLTNRQAGSTLTNDKKMEVVMNGKDDISIAKKMGISVLDLHGILERFEKLNARELNLLAMQLINRATMKLEVAS